MMDFNTLPPPEFPSQRAIDRVAATPAPGPQIAKALAQLSALENEALDAAEAGCLVEFPRLATQSGPREKARRDLGYLLRLAAMNLSETEEGRDAAIRMNAARTMVAGVSGKGIGRYLRMGCRLMGAKLKERLRGPGGDAVARELSRVAVGATGEPPAVPMIAHASSHKPPRAPNPGELEAIMQAHPEMALVVHAARTIVDRADELAAEAAKRVEWTCGRDGRDLSVRDSVYFVWMAVHGMLRGDRTIPRLFGEECAGYFHAAPKITFMETQAMFRALQDVALEKLGHWTGGLVHGYLAAGMEGLYGPEPNWPHLDDIRRLASCDPSVEPMTLRLIASEPRILSETSSSFFRAHAKYAAKHQKNGREPRESQRDLAHVLRAAGAAALTGDMDSFDRWLTLHRRSLSEGAKMSPDEILDAFLALAQATRVHCPDAERVAQLVQYAAEFLSGADHRMPASMAPELQAVMKREAKIAKAAAAQSIAKFPNFHKTYGPRGADHCLRDIHYMFRYCVEAAETNDREAFVRRVLRERRLLEAVGSPPPMMAELFPALSAAAGEPRLNGWFQLGAELMDARLPEPVSPATVSDPARRRAVDFLGRHEEEIARRASETLLVEMPFMERDFRRPSDRRLASAHDLCQRDDAFLLRQMAEAVATDDMATLDRRVRRHACFLPRVGAPRAALRRSIDLMREAASRLADESVRRQLDPVFQRAAEVALQDSAGRQALRSFLEFFEGRMPSKGQRNALLVLDPAAEPLLAVMDEVAAKREAMATGVIDAVYSRFEYERAHERARDKGVRDVTVVLAYMAHSLVLGSRSYFEDRLLHWLRTIFMAFRFPGGGESIRLAYETLKLEARRHLSADAAAMLGPYLNAAAEVLPAAGSGAVAANAAMPGSLWQS